MVVLIVVSKKLLSFLLADSFNFNKVHDLNTSWFSWCASKWRRKRCSECKIINNTLWPWRKRCRVIQIHHLRGSLTQVWVIFYTKNSKFGWTWWNCGLRRTYWYWIFGPLMFDRKYHKKRFLSLQIQLSTNSSCGSFHGYCWLCMVYITFFNLPRLATVDQNYEFIDNHRQPVKSN